MVPKVVNSAQYRKIRPFPKNLRSQILGLSPYSLTF